MNCMYAAHFVYPFVYPWTLGRFPLLGAVNSAARKCVGRDNFQVLLSILFVIYPEVGPGLFFIPPLCSKGLKLMFHNQQLPAPTAMRRC